MDQLGAIQLTHVSNDTGGFTSNNNRVSARFRCGDEKRRPQSCSLLEQEDDLAFVSVNLRLLSFSASPRLRGKPAFLEKMKIPLRPPYIPPNLFLQRFH